MSFVVCWPLVYECVAQDSVWLKCIQGHRFITNEANILNILFFLSAYGQLEIKEMQDFLLFTKFFIRDDHGIQYEN